MTLRMISWNVNGIRAVLRKDALAWLAQDPPDIFCLQETKARPEQLDGPIPGLEGHHAYWAWADRKGYSGVAIFSREAPVRVTKGFGIERFDSEGRVLVAEYPDFTLLNVYFPNGKSGAERLAYKLAFYDAILEFMDGLRAEGRTVICCGDLNTAHHAIDLARPRENEGISGFLPVEREWMDRLEGRGFVDVFRQFNTEPGQYSYWDMKSRARDRNVGWRIDYWFVSDDAAPRVTAAFILPEIMGSDHCPVGIEIEPRT